MKVSGMHSPEMEERRAVPRHECLLFPLSTQKVHSGAVPPWRALYSRGKAKTLVAFLSLEFFFEAIKLRVDWDRLTLFNSYQTASTVPTSYSSMRHSQRSTQIEYQIIRAGLQQ